MKPFCLVPFASCLSQQINGVDEQDLVLNALSSNLKSLLLWRGFGIQSEIDWGKRLQDNYLSAKESRKFIINGQLSIAI